VIETTGQKDMLEQQFANTVVATDPNPNTANLTIADIRLAIEAQFGHQAIPLAISKFRSDSVIQFASQDERDMVALSEILEGHGFDMLLVTWSNRYGGRIVDWDTAVTIDRFPHPCLQPICSRTTPFTPLQHPDPPFHQFQRHMPC
jgi:hypothetical protein